MTSCAILRAPHEPGLSRRLHTHYALRFGAGQLFPDAHIYDSLCCLKRSVPHYRGALVDRIGIKLTNAIEQVRAVRAIATFERYRRSFLSQDGLMDWFEKLTGFQERDYDDTRAKLKVEGQRLRSLINDKEFCIGELELVSLETLRQRVTVAGELPGRLRVRVVTGDVRQMHRLPENAGALFQVASQFNLLEMISSGVTPEQGVTRYQHDRTQGPACAIAAGAATIYRNYFVPVDGGQGQSVERQLDGLVGLGKTLAAALNLPINALWEMKNGYPSRAAAFLDYGPRRLTIMLRLPQLEYATYR